MGLLLNQSLVAEEFPDLGSTYRNASIKQGSLILRKADQYFKDRYYDQCIQELNSFGLVHPNHPDKLVAWSLMSRAYQKKRDFRKSAEIELSIFLENPTSREGYLAYLSAARSYIKVGETEFAKRIFTEIQESSYFPDIAQEASLELRQWMVISGDQGQKDKYKEKEI
jgi:tetratricopeptide (TPR) repeat protein